MATRKRIQKKARKPARKKATKKNAAKKKVAKKKAARRSAARPARRAARAAAPAVSRIGVVTHTELASNDPEATQAWCEQVFGWKFESMPTPSGPYRMWRSATNTGGGIRANNPPETPGSIPYCEVADIRESYDAALSAGAQEMLAPQPLPGGMGFIAIVAAPGGVAFGLWGPK